MITIKSTENFTGVCISGDYNDLDQLVNAFYNIALDENTEKHQSHIRIATRVLGLCYDVRHALQGDREVELIDNGMDKDKMKFQSVVTPVHNVYFKCNYLYPEMFFVMLALNKLVKLRMRDLIKTKYSYNEAFNKLVIWDDTIATIRSFQAKFVECVKGVLTQASFSRWLKFMTCDIDIQEIAGQYVDVQNLKYISMSTEKRLKNLTIIAKRIAEFRSDVEHREIKKVVSETAKEHGVCESDIRLRDIEYPEVILW